MDVHLRELRALVAVADAGSVTAAAERLHLAQPALSRQLQSLERQVGVPLLVRLPRGVALTASGRALVEAAREAVAAADRGLAAARATPTVRELVVGMQTAVGRGVQRSALARFAQLAPGVTPSLRLVAWDDPTAGLADATSDVAFVWLPVPFADVDVLPVAEEQRHVAMPADHPLAALDTVPFALLLDEPFVALPDAAGPLREFWLATDARDRPPIIGAVAATPDAVFEAVLAGLGVVLLAAGNADLYARPGIITRPVDGTPPAVLALAWRSTDRRREVAAFVRAVDEQVTPAATTTR